MRMSEQIQADGLLIHVESRHHVILELNKDLHKLVHFVKTPNDLVERWAAQRPARCNRLLCVTASFVSL